MNDLILSVSRLSINPKVKRRKFNKNTHTLYTYNVSCFNYLFREAVSLMSHFAALLSGKGT